MTNPSNNSSRMSQPWFMQGREYRRDGVAVNGDDAWALFCASADGDLDRATELLDRDPNLVHAQIWYAKPIDLAMREGHLDILKVMLAADAQRWLFDHTVDWCYVTTENELSRRGFDELTAYRKNWKANLAPDYRPEFSELGECIQGGKASTWRQQEAAQAQVIAAVDADDRWIRATNRRGLTLLHLALEAQDIVLVTALLKRGAQLEAKTVHGWTPMDYAVEYFSPAIPLLLHHGAEMTLGAMIARGMNGDLLERLQADASEINELDIANQTALTLATRLRKTEAVKMLLEFGADPNRPVPDGTHGDALYIATENWCHAIMRLLLEAGANPNAEVDSSGCCLSTLVDHKKWGNHPAREAYELLVAHGAVDLEEVDFSKHPQEVTEQIFPVHWMKEVAEIENWAKHYGRERLGNLWWGLGPHSRPGREALEVLIRYGHDVSRTDWWGRTLLQAEAAEGDLERAKMLLELGADLHAIDVQSRTNALGYAARNGHVEMVKFLLEQGADKNPDVPLWGKPLTYANDFLQNHHVRYCESAHDQSRFNGHRTNQAKPAYQQVIQLLS